MIPLDLVLCILMNVAIPMLIGLLFIYNINKNENSKIKDMNQFYDHLERFRNGDFKEEMDEIRKEREKLFQNKKEP